jgi:hypothetical protein
LVPVGHLGGQTLGVITMDGFLIKFTDAPHPASEPSFRRLFGAIYAQMNAHYWCFPMQPWMGTPVRLCEDKCTVELDNGGMETALWRPGSLGKYADSFLEEHIEMWAVPHGCVDKATLVSEFDKTSLSSSAFIVQNADIWLIYTDSACWEMFARSNALLSVLDESLMGKANVATFRSRSDMRGNAFNEAGLTEVWHSLFPGG